MGHLAQWAQLRNDLQPSIDLDMWEVSLGGKVDPQCSCNLIPAPVSSTRMEAQVLAATRAFVSFV